MLRAAVVFCVLVVVSAGPPLTRSRQEIQEYADYLEKSKNGTNDGATLSDRMAANPLASEWENSGKYGGDMVLDDHQIKGMVDAYSSRHAYIFPGTRWPGNLMIYEFAPNTFTQAQIQAVWRAMHEIEMNSCIRFRFRNPNEHNFVLVTGNPDGCYASVGWWWDRTTHTLNLARANPGQGCFRNGVIIHEILHNLGFFHMHMTYTRDHYVRMLWENMIRGTEFAFEKHGNNLVSNLGIPYEYVSVMHYGSHAFSANGRPTIVPLRHVNGVMGQTNFVTWWDYLRLRRHYNCPGAWARSSMEEGKVNTEAPEGYVPIHIRDAEYLKNYQFREENED